MEKIRMQLVQVQRHGRSRFTAEIRHSFQTAALNTVEIGES